MPKMMHHGSDGNCSASGWMRRCACWNQPITWSPIKRIWIARGRATTTPLIDAGLAMLARFVGKSGATIHGELTDLHEALARDEADAVIALGGTGGGRDDESVRTLARLGRVEAHGIAVAPGETAAFGFAGERPVLLMPGRIDAALALWLLIGRRLVAKLAGGVSV